jgi:hypothetical protein
MDYKEYIGKIGRQPTMGPFFISDIEKKINKITGREIYKPKLYFLGQNGLSKSTLTYDDSDFESMRIVDTRDVKIKFIKRVFGE